MPERLGAEHPHGTGIFKESSLVKAKSSMCCPLGILARMDSEQMSVESKPFLVWSDFSPSFPAICFCCKAVSLMKRDRGCWELPRLERPSGPTCTLRWLLSGQHSGLLHGIYREFGWDLSKAAIGGCMVGLPVACADSVPEAVHCDLDEVLLPGTLCKGSLGVVHSWSRSSTDCYGAWCDAVVGFSIF